MEGRKLWQENVESRRMKGRLLWRGMTRGRRLHREEREQESIGGRRKKGRHGKENKRASNGAGRGCMERLGKEVSREGKERTTE